MKKNEIMHYLDIIGIPLVLIGLGLILMFNPDSASALLSNLLGWMLMACAVGAGLTALAGSGNQRVGRLVVALILAGVGFWLVNHPLSLASGLGRVIGIMLALRGLPDLLNARKEGRGLPILPVILTALGAVLILVPLTASRLIFNIGGIVLLCVGIAMLVDALRGKKKLDEPEDPNIIDADE